MQNKKKSILENFHEFHVINNYQTVNSEAYLENSQSSI